MPDLRKMRIVLDVGRGVEVQRTRYVIQLADAGEAVADVYRPGGAAPDDVLPVVLFVHGDASPDHLATVLEWGQYRSWGEAVAARGLCAVVIQHRSSERMRFARSLRDSLVATIDRLRHEAVPGIDGDRIGVWACSAGSTFGVSAALLARPPVAFIVSYYGFLDIRHAGGRVDPSLTAGDLAAVSAVAIVEQGWHVPPTLIVKAALDDSAVNESIDRYVAAVRGRGDMRLEVHPGGHHGFDVLDDDPVSASIIGRTLEFMTSHLA